MEYQLRLCEKIAHVAHFGQQRRDGSAYVAHPKGVASLLHDPIHKCVAWLHDVLEDTRETYESLIEAGVDKSIVDLVVVLTRKPGQSYDEYIQGILN